MISKYSILLLLLAAFLAGAATPTVSSFQELAQNHCKNYPIELIYRLSSGQLAEIYGPHFADLDCYVRQFVNKGNLSLTQMARTPWRSKKRMTKKMKISPIRRKRLFLRTTPSLSSTLVVWMSACPRELTPLKQCMPFGASTASSSSMITLWSGCGLKSEPLWAMKQRDRVPGWTGNKAQPDYASISCFRISSTTTWTS